MWRVILLISMPFPAISDSLVAARNLPARTVIGADDLMLVAADIPGALTGPAPAIGQETRVSIYAGRPVRAGDLGPPALVDRNTIVTLVYRAGAMTIRAEGRALARGGAGEVVRALNLSSKTTVSGVVGPDGDILVGDMP